jgi:hypothetical protein
MKRMCFAVCALFVLVDGWAGEADVVDGGIRALGNDRYAIYATILHSDEGWEHYVNKWQVVGDDGVVYGTKVLRHPHVHEQPFSRGLYGVVIPPAVAEVTLRAFDSVHSDGGRELHLAVPKEQK